MVSAQELKKLIYDDINSICHYSQLQVYASSHYQNNFFQVQIDDCVEDLICKIQEYIDEYGRFPLYERNSVEYDKEQSEESLEDGSESLANGVASEMVLLEFTPEELAYYDGTNGRPVYVAVQGRVFDLSAVPIWSTGLHFGMIAGRDLTPQFTGCHQGILDRLLNKPIVGILRQEPGIDED